MQQRRARPGACCCACTQRRRNAVGVCSSDQACRGNMVLLSTAKTHCRQEIGDAEARVWVVLRSTVGQAQCGRNRFSWFHLSGDNSRDRQTRHLNPKNSDIHPKRAIVRPLRVCFLARHAPNPEAASEGAPSDRDLASRLKVPICPRQGRPDCVETGAVLDECPSILDSNFR